MSLMTIRPHRWWHYSSTRCYTTFLLLLQFTLQVFIVNAQSGTTVQLYNSQAVTGSISPGSTDHYYYSAVSHTVVNPLSSISASLAGFSTSQALLVASLSANFSQPSSSGTSVPSSISTKKVVSTSTSKTTKHQARQLSTGPVTILSIYFSFTICTQPIPPSNAPTQYEIPQLVIYLSTTDTLPGPNQPSTSSINYTVPNTGFYAGYVNVTIPYTPSTEPGNIYVGVYAPPLPGAGIGWTSNWTYQIGASISAPVHSVISPDILPQPIQLDDTDNMNAMFLAWNFANQSSSYKFYIIPTTSLSPSLSRSLCALQAANSLMNQTFQITINQTTRGPYDGQKQQILVTNLNQNTTYVAYYVSEGSQAGAGSMSQPIFLRTKTDPNCRLIYNLPFCSEVAYAVPATPNTTNISSLAILYDDQASQIYQSFNIALSQFNCETTRYSPVRNCTDCARDYKTWLCAVLIPRCTISDTSLIDPMVLPSTISRDVNQSRNPWIDQTIIPGSYRELLPCADLCYHVMQSCPPFLQFLCPIANTLALNYALWIYGPPSNMNVSMWPQEYGYSNPTCNSMGVDSATLDTSQAANGWWGSGGSMARGDVMTIVWWSATTAGVLLVIFVVG